MSSNQFVQKLRTLKPLPRHVEVEQPPPPELEDEDPEQEQEDEDEEEDNVSEGNHDETSYSYSDSGSSRTPLRPRTYMLYEADEDDSGESHDERRVEPPRQKQQGGRYGSNTPQTSYSHIQGGGKDTSRHQDLSGCDGVSMDPHSAVAHHGIFVEPAAERGHKSPKSSLHIQGAGSTINHNPGSSRQQQAGPQSASRTRPLSTEGVSQMTRTSKTEISSGSSCANERLWKPIKGEPDQPTLELVDEIIWEVDDDEKGDKHKDDRDDIQSRAGVDRISEQSVIVQPQGNPLIDENPTLLMSYESQRVQDLQPHCNSLIDENPTLLMSYESQCLEDLDFAGWSQLTGRENTNTPAASVGCNKIVPRRLIQDDEDDEDDIACLEFGDLV